MWFQVILFDMSPVLLPSRNEMLLFSLTLSDTYQQVCLYSHLHYIRIQLYVPILWQSPTLKSNQLFSIFSPFFFNITPLGKLHSADG